MSLLILLSCLEVGIANHLRYVSFAWKDPKNITDELNAS